MLSRGLLEWDLGQLADALKLTPEEVRTYFTDGRRVSFVLERRLAREVLRGTLAASEGAGYDLIDAAGRKWEVRSISRGGIYFCPSYMVGSGRCFKEPGFFSKLDEVAGYVVSDISLFPKVPYWIVEAAVVRDWWKKGLLGSSTQISRDKALALLQKAL